MYSTVVLREWRARGCAEGLGSWKAVGSAADANASAASWSHLVVSSKLRIEASDHATPVRAETSSCVA
eukprot:CAMPEP_0173114152 /NCGR_PEP_ID=MMETSP1102-20130122/47417_1 /TAXON_ID=49646 /ORGANISM="Geminigera sp., Strain Caron Lab Isolate" /LENGTH=67 /DNA_ID=CAMNT_0014016307 /DNA_START=308 /DNA_END=511 /DNA_ORIENTATION=-